MSSTSEPTGAQEPDDFARYRDEHGIKPHEEPAAFAAWLNEQDGWDGRMVEVDTDDEDDAT